MVVDGKTYKLVYYDLKTLGEPIRQIFHYIGVPFEDVRVDPATWSDVKEGTFRITAFNLKCIKSILSSRLPLATPSGTPCQ